MLKLITVVSRSNWSHCFVLHLFNLRSLTSNPVLLCHRCQDGWSRQVQAATGGHCCEYLTLKPSHSMHLSVGKVNPVADWLFINRCSGESQCGVASSTDVVLHNLRSQISINKFHVFLQFNERKWIIYLKKNKTVKAKFQSERAIGPVEAFEASAKKMKGNQVKGDQTHTLRSHNGFGQSSEYNRKWDDGVLEIRQSKSRDLWNGSEYSTESTSRCLSSIQLDWKSLFF